MGVKITVTVTARKDMNMMISFFSSSWSFINLFCFILFCENVCVDQ